MILLILVEFSYFGIFSCKEETFLNTLKNKRLGGHYILSIREMKVKECIFECSLRDGCGSVNYHVEDMVCMLNKDVDESKEKKNIIIDKGWNYYKKQKKVKMHIL